MDVTQIADGGKDLNLVFDNGDLRDTPKLGAVLEHPEGSEILYLFRGRIKAYAFDWNKITSPVTANVEELKNTINGYLNNR
jgi:hypothetical protein